MRNRIMFLALVAMMLIPTVGFSAPSSSTVKAAVELQNREDAIRNDSRHHTDQEIDKIAARIGNRDRAAARKYRTVTRQLRKARNERSSLRTKVSKVKAGLARAEANQASNVAEWRASHAAWDNKLGGVSDRVTALEKRVTHLCHGVDTSVQAACLETLNIKEREVTSRSKTKEEEATSRAATAQQERTKRKASFLNTAVFMHTRCKSGEDGEGSKLNCAKGNSPNGKVTLKVLRNGKLSKEVYEFTPNSSSPVAVQPQTRAEHFALPAPVVGTPDNNGFTPDKGWSSGAVYGTAGVTGLVLGGVAGYLSGRPLKVNMVDGVPAGETKGTQTRNMLVGMLAGPIVTMGATAAWRAATSD